MYLLLLTLALLGSPARTAGKLRGFPAGTYFDEFDLNGNQVTGLRISTGLAGKIFQIQGKFGNSWGSPHGFQSIHTQELELWAGEYITQIHGSYMGKIWYLVICTTCERCFSFGKKCGQEFSDYPSEPDQVLAGFYGYFGPAGMSGLGFRWASLPENSTLLCN